MNNAHRKLAIPDDLSPEWASAGFVFPGMPFTHFEVGLSKHSRAQVEAVSGLAL